MIRREWSDPAAGPGWLLISQIEHARIAGAVAAEWGAAPFSPLPVRDELLVAVIRHDDGWARWERRPDVDPASGRPRDFLEMPVDQSLLLWRASIERAAELSPLGGFVVASHFLSLIEHADIWRQHGSRPAAAAHQWAADFTAQRQQWLEQWCAQRPEAHTPALAEAAAAWLKFFDRLSLWLCMTPTAEPAELPAPHGPPLTFVPRGDQAVAINPWPLTVAELQLSIIGRQVPARRYADAANLAAEPEPLVVLPLRLVPAD